MAWSARVRAAWAGLCLVMMAGVAAPSHTSQPAAPVGTIVTVAGSGGEGPVGSVGSFPTGVAIGGDRMYVADANGAVVRMIDLKTGAGRGFAGTGAVGDSGDGGPATRAQLEPPLPVCLG